jgi:hypothetical protein
LAHSHCDSALLVLPRDGLVAGAGSEKDPQGQLTAGFLFPKSRS